MDPDDLELGSHDLYFQKETTIERDDHSPRVHAPWKVRFTTPTGPASSSSNVEYMTQGELITLWQQIGALFNLSGMREGLTNTDLERIGVKR